MSNISPQGTESTVVESSTTKKKSYKKEIAIITVMISIAALVTAGICYLIGDFSSSVGYVLTFWVSFLIGLGGAGVYLTLLLLVEGDLKILNNIIMDNKLVMSFFFLLSGGFVAAITQVSAGLLISSGIQSVFMVGFGWLGALSGVAGIKTRAKLSEENKELHETKEELQLELSDTDEEIIFDIEALQEQNAELIETVAELQKKLSDTINNTTDG